MLRDEIIPYLDGQGFVAPTLENAKETRGSDNQMLFTSELYIVLVLLDEDMPKDAIEWEKKARQCMAVLGLTVRSPGDLTPDAPDNIVGILAAATLLDVPSVAKDMFWYGIKHGGFFDPRPVPPPFFTKERWVAFEWRQPQLLFATLCAAGYYNWLTCWVLWPLAIYSAIVITFGGFQVPVDRTDERILSWLLLIATCKSRMCYWAGLLWEMRLSIDYANGMSSVLSSYFGGDHPIAKYSPKEV